MRNTILQRLEDFSREQGFRILFACETGSRGWGFASPDSDFDIRFIYVHERDAYLRLTPPPDTFSLMEERDGEVLDFNAWDLRKVLQHTRRSNATVFEWLQSPIIYREEPGFLTELWSLVQPHFSARATVHHYLGICHNSMKSGIDGDQINIKKYFYVLRPLLAAMWAADRRTIPPMEFRPLLAQIPDHQTVTQAINNLWVEKEKAAEGAMIPLIPVIQEFVTAEMNRCNEVAPGLPAVHFPDDELNLFLLKHLK